MNFTNAKLILFREIRDQLRDRRTLFMMFVLPILLYPLLGMSFLQISQFMRERATSVLVIGAGNLGDLPRLIDNQSFSKELFSDPREARLLKLQFAPAESRGDVQAVPDQLAEARRAVQTALYDAALYFPQSFADEMEDYQRAIEQWTERVAEGEKGQLPRLPKPKIIYTTANERSQITHLRLSGVLDRWSEEVRKTVWAAGGLPPSASKPVDVETDDVADQTRYRGAALWSKILPVLLLIWALTGAFYPAVDLCAGEKERGTLETLLSSPAERSEIVLGKLLTIMLFSMITAVLNLAAIGLTAWLVLGHRPEFGPPPPLAVLWLAIALVPVSALFSALCLALAAFARSSKEGQYYLMPLLLVTMPLAFLPMSPGVELNLGNSLIPVTGVVLLLRSVLEGSYWPALQLLPVVVAVTLAACLLAIRWAVEQFNSESVLFRESERLEVRLWLRHLRRDRQPTPTVAQAVFCGVVILVAQFFMTFAQPQLAGFRDLAQRVVTIQLVVVATPVLLMTVVLTGSPRQTLLLKRPPWATIPATLLLAAVLHPAVMALRTGVVRLYPISENAEAALTALEQMISEAPLWQALLVLALVPAICEELAFRGFVLSGFRHLGHKWRAIIYAALFFGLTHGILQQSLIACLVGVVIGYVVVQSGSIVPGVIFHLVHNALPLATDRITPELLDRQRWLHMLVFPAAEGRCAYDWPVVVGGGLVALLVFVWFSRLPCAKSAEEQLQETIERGLSADDP